MSVSVFWFLPTHGDGHYLGTAEGARPVDHGYLQQVAKAADRLGFGGVLIPTCRSCEDAWLVAASLIPVTQRLRFLVALRPGVISPTQAARQAATLDRLSNGRALFNLVTGGDPEELAGDGPTVAARMQEYQDLGIETFILSGYPHLEEAYRVVELLFPHLDLAIPEIPQPRVVQAHGEAVANDFTPQKVAQS
ncbi:hypothetical protein E05_10910 [Plautia stali symbiont]|nr:hypothetical protein E05_10910 [Plautia stali symbiont]